MEITLGPVRCHDCHLPTLVRVKGIGGKWMERQWKFVRGEHRPVLVPHRCTARSGQPMFEFAR